MARVTPIQTNFTSGELSPRLDGRVDFEKYYNGCKRLENFIVHPHGGATRRSGTHFVSEVKDSSKKARLIPFEFNVEQAYVLEFGDLYMRVYKDQGVVGAPYEIATPYLEAELFEIDFVQSADTMYIVHGNHAPRKLTRAGHESWALTQITFIDGPYLPNNTTATTITPSGTSGTITLTASAALFQAGHIGSYWQINLGPGPGYVKVTGYTDTTHVTATVEETLGGTTATTDWDEGAWSDVRGYPRTVTFYQNRLMFGGTSNSPQTVWGSKSSDYENMTAGANDADAIVYTIVSRQVNVIRWMAPTRSLVIGTSGGEFTMSSGANGPITPSSVSVKSESTFGSSDVRPVQIGNSVLYVQRSGKKLREARYNYDDDAYVSHDLTILSEHITGAGITNIAYQQEPDSLVWATRSDGWLIGLTYERPQEVVAWHKHYLGGEIESIASIPADGYDEMWVVVKRTIDGSVKRYVEFFDPGEWAGSSQFQWNSLNTDSALTYSGAATSSVTGLDHLEGETVKVLVDGATHPDAVVTSGAITLNDSYTEVEVGLGYTSTLQTIRPEAGSASGTAQGKKKRWNEVIVYLYESLGISINGDVVPFRTSADEMNEPPGLYTGIKRVTNLGFDRDGHVTIVQAQPLPSTILMISGTLNVTD